MNILFYLIMFPLNIMSKILSEMFDFIAYAISEIIKAIMHPLLSMANIITFMLPSALMGSVKTAASHPGKTAAALFAVVTKLKNNF